LVLAIALVVLGIPTFILYRLVQRTTRRM